MRCRRARNVCRHVTLPMGMRRARPLMSSGTRAVSVALVGIRKETTPVQISHEVLLERGASSVRPVFACVKRQQGNSARKRMSAAPDETVLRPEQVGRVTPCAPPRIESQQACEERITKPRHRFVLPLQGKCFFGSSHPGRLAWAIMSLRFQRGKIAPLQRAPVAS